MTTNNPLNEAANVTLDGSGNGTVSMGPVTGERWKLTNAGVRTNTSSNPAANVPQCRIYIGGAPIDSFFIDGTFTGNLNSTSRVSGIPVGNGQRIWAVWQGGDPGSVATLSIIGTSESNRS